MARLRANRGPRLLNGQTGPGGCRTPSSRTRWCVRPRRSSGVPWPLRSPYGPAPAAGGAPCRRRLRSCCARPVRSRPARCAGPRCGCCSRSSWPATGHASPAARPAGICPQAGRRCGSGHAPVPAGHPVGVHQAARAPSARDHQKTGIFATFLSCVNVCRKRTFLKTRDNFCEIFCSGRQTDIQVPGASQVSRRIPAARTAFLSKLKLWVQPSA